MSEYKMAVKEDRKKAEILELERRLGRARKQGSKTAGVEEELKEVALLWDLTSRLLAAVHKRETKGGILAECETPDYNKLCQAFQVMLRAAGEGSPEGVVVLVDGIDDLKCRAGAAQRSLNWMPAMAHVPPNVHLIVSSSDDPAFLKFLPNGLVAKEIDIGNLPRIAQGQLMHGLLKKEGRLLSIDQERSLVTKQDISSPLFINAACKAMKASLLRKDYSELLIDIRQLPHHTHALLDGILARIESEHGVACVSLVLSSIYLCHGLFEEEIIYLIDEMQAHNMRKEEVDSDGEPLTARTAHSAYSKDKDEEIVMRGVHGSAAAIYWPCLYKSLSVVLWGRGGLRDGIVSFAHKAVAEVVKDRYLFNKEKIDKVHAKMVVILSKQLFVGRGPPDEVQKWITEVLKVRSYSEETRMKAKWYTKRYRVSWERRKLMAAAKEAADKATDGKASIPEGGKCKESEARDLAFETPRTVEVHSRAVKAQLTMKAALSEMSTVMELNPCLEVLKGHTGEVLAIDWSKDGEMIASAGHDEAIHVWKSRSGEMILRMKGHSSKVYGVAWSPDGKLIASCSRDMSVRLWDIYNWDGGALDGSLNCIAVLHGHKLPVFCVSWSKDGSCLASGSGDMTVKIWLSATKECLVTLRGHTGAIYSVDWISPIRLAS